MATPYQTLLAPPVFVVGYMHSGTTLLLNILAGNTAVFSGRGETKFFDYLPMIRHTYPNLNDERVVREFTSFVIDVVRYGYKLGNGRADRHRGELLDKEHEDALVAEIKKHRDHAAAFRTVSDYLTRLAGKTRWLEKTPTHVLQIDQIVESVPQALFVEITRDPRDVLASKKTRRLTVWGTDRFTAEQRPMKHLEKAYDPFWDTLSWKSAVRAGRIAHAKYPGRVFSIRYEDLVTDPEGEIRKLCAFLRMEFEPQMLEVGGRNSAERGVQASEGIAADAVGRWRRTLAPAEVALCQSLVKAELELLGHERNHITAAQRAKMPVLVARSAFEFAQRLFRRWKLGGSLYSVNILINYWKRFLKLVHG